MSDEKQPDDQLQVWSDVEQRWVNASEIDERYGDVFVEGGQLTGESRKVEVTPHDGGRGTLGVPSDPAKQYPGQEAYEPPAEDDPLATYDGVEEPEVPNHEESPAAARARRKAKRNEIRTFGRATHRGDMFMNRWFEHGRHPGSRQLVVEQNVRGTALFVLRDTGTGKITTMRARTLMERYERVDNP